MKLFLLVVFSYFLGAIPFSYLIARAKGVALHQSGTKNIGASNVILTTGAKEGAFAMFLDGLKGLVPVILGRYFLVGEWGIVLLVLAAVIGHDFSVYLKFKGGKGLATSGGAFLAIDPYLTLFCFFFYWAVYLFIKQFILTTLILLTLLPFFVFVFGLHSSYVFLAAGLALLYYWTHRKDLRSIIMI